MSFDSSYSSGYCYTCFSFVPSPTVLPFPVKIYPFEIFTRATPGSSLVFNRTEWNQDRKVHVPEITRFLMLRYHERTQGDPELSKFPFHSINNTAFHPHYNTTCLCVSIKHHSNHKQLWKWHSLFHEGRETVIPPS